MKTKKRIEQQLAYYKDQNDRSGGLYQQQVVMLEWVLDIRK